MDQQESNARLAASIQLTVNVYIIEEPEVNTPNGHELPYAHIQVLDYELNTIDVVETKRDTLKGLYHSDGIIELDPDGVFSEAVHEALDQAVPEYYEI